MTTAPTSKYKAGAPLRRGPFSVTAQKRLGVIVRKIWKIVLVVAKPLTKYDAFEIFSFAEEFRTSADLLREAYMPKWDCLPAHVAHGNDEARHALAAARVMTSRYAHKGTVASHLLLALSAELHLKCLHRVRRRNPPRGHNLLNLYSELSQRDRREIKKRYLDTCNCFVSTPDTGKEVPISIQSSLQRARAYFVDLRYGYESASPRSPRAEGIHGSLGIDHVVLAVRGQILAKHPEWEEQFLNRKHLD